MTTQDEGKFYHVEITVKEAKPPHRQRELECDLTLNELERRFLAPYRMGRSVVIRGRPIPMDELHRIRVYVSERSIGKLNPIPWQWTNDATNEFITGEPGLQTSAVSLATQEPTPPPNTRDVFVIHGRNTDARKALFEFLRSIDLHPLEWSEAVHATGKPSPFIGEILDSAFSRAHAVVALFTPDDEARLRAPYRQSNESTEETELKGQARPNVLFESGMAMARHPDRTVLVELGNLRAFSDVAGRHMIRIEKTPQWRQDLAQRLETAGCPVSTSGSDWLTAGDFEAALATLTEVASEPVSSRSAQPTDPSPVPLSVGAQTLLVEASIDQHGILLAARTMGGRIISTNGKSFVERGNARSEAEWEQALGELLNHGLIVDPNGNGEGFRVTHLGYQYADALSGEEPDNGREGSS